MKKIEVLADAISFINTSRPSKPDGGLRIYDPTLPAYQLRNPGLIRAFSFRHLANTNKNGLRIFSSIIGGLRSLIEDLTVKLTGKSRAKGKDGRLLRDDSTLVDILWSYNIRAAEDVFQTIDFINKALSNNDISSETPASFFLQE